MPIRRPSVIDPILDSKVSSFSKQKTSVNLKGELKEDNFLDNKDDRVEVKNIDPTDNEDKEVIDSFVSRSLLSNKLQLLWAPILAFTHAYHIVVTFYYLAIDDYPKNELYALQCFCEFVLIFDLIMKLLLKKFDPEVWDTMWLLHDYYSLSTKFGLFCSIFASIPIMFIIS